MVSLTGKKILVTGVSGKVGVPMSQRLLNDGNEVWGVSRFTNQDRKRRLDDMGVVTRYVDLMNPDFSELPEHFDHVIHLGGDVCQGDETGIYMPNGKSFYLANRVNAVATGKLMSRFRNADSILVTSTTGVFEKRAAEFWDQKEVEDGRLGPFHADAPQYSSSKNAQEAVAQFAAEEFGVKTTIARMGCQVSSIEGGLAAGYVGAIMMDMPFPGFHTDRPSVYQYIHDDDLYDHLPGLLDIAATTPETLNWTGQETVDMRDVARLIATRLGKGEPEFIADPWGLCCTLSDTTKLVEMVGPCKLDWKESFNRVMDELLPEHPRVQ